MGERSRARCVAGALVAKQRQRRRAAGQGKAQHLLACWPRLAGRMRRAEHLAVFLDFDGTLVPLRRRPEDVWLDDPARRLLQRLARRSRVTLYLISGRRRPDLRRRTRVRGAHLLGLHGWEGNGRPPAGIRTLRLLRRAGGLIESRLMGLSGIWVEDKSFSVAVHYRGAPGGSDRQVRALVQGVVGSSFPDLRLLEGKKVLEVLPCEVQGKGAAVRAVLAELPGSPVPVYLGDDTTDEGAFAAIPRGISVCVGRTGRTQARFFLRNPQEVMTFLANLEAELA